MLDRLIWYVYHPSNVLKRDYNHSLPFFPSKLVTPITKTILTGICKCGSWNTSMKSSSRMQVDLREPWRRFRCQVL